MDLGESPGYTRYWNILLEVCYGMLLSMAGGEKGSVFTFTLPLAN